MRRATGISVLLLLTIAVGASRPGAHSTAAQEAGAGEWIDLFDGESFAGWRGVGMDTVPTDHWMVQDGTLHNTARRSAPTLADGQLLDGDDLMTVDTFRDFELVLEWKVSPGGNSGIKYNVSETMSTGMKPVHAALGFEFQILDDERHPDALNGPNRMTGALYDILPPLPDKELKPVGSFNEARIVFRDGHGEHWLNGRKVVEFDLESAAFDSAYVLSKYLPIEGFADIRSGHIVLQDHGDDVWFRNIRIRKITP